jgi:uncharacterized membrane protein YcjF (UPF0283 family)
MNALAPIAGKALPLEDMKQEVAAAKQEINEAGTAVEAYAATTVTLQAVSALAMLGMFYIAWQKHKREEKKA